MYRLRRIHLSVKRAGIFLLLLALRPVAAETADMAIKLGDQFLARGSYYEAETEYKRFLFFHRQDNEGLSMGYSKLAHLYGVQKKWEEAAILQEKTVQLSVEGPLKEERTFLLITYLITGKQYDKAERELQKLYYRNEGPQVKKRALFLLAVNSVYQFRWEGAEHFFLEYLQTGTPYTEAQIEELKLLLAQSRDLERKSPATAIVLSLLLPGMGQMYGGNWTDGVNSLLLNTATGLLVGYNIYKANYITSITAFLSLSSRFYEGNLSNAVKAAEEYNDQQDRKTAALIIDTLLNGRP